MIKLIQPSAAAAVAIILCSWRSSAQANEGYYVLIFGSQSHPKLLKYTHTWATFVRAVGDESNPDRSLHGLSAHPIMAAPNPECPGLVPFSRAGG
jgi:hypothetical protein